MGETADWIARNAENDEGTDFSFVDYIDSYECSACGWMYGTRGWAERHVRSFRKKEQYKIKQPHKNACVHENHDGEEMYFYRLPVK